MAAGLGALIPTSNNPYDEAARAIWQRYERYKKIDLARQALITAGMPDDHPNALELAQQVIDFVEKSGKNDAIPGLLPVVYDRPPGAL